MYLPITPQAIFSSISIFPKHQIRLFYLSPSLQLFLSKLDFIYLSIVFLSKTSWTTVDFINQGRNFGIIHDFFHLPLSLIPYIHLFTEFCWIYLLNIFWISHFPSILVPTSALLGTISLLFRSFPVFGFISLRFTFSELPEWYVWNINLKILYWLPIVNVIRF